MANKIRVGIVGGGVIGKRDADGITAQEDMQLSGVADISDSALISVINMNRGYKLFASSEDARRKMEELYKPFVRQGNPVYFMDERSAEMTKYAANSFLAAKISFIPLKASLSSLLDKLNSLLKFTS